MTQEYRGIAFTLVTAAILVVWSRVAPSLGCVPSALLLALAWGLITLAGADFAFIRRRAFIGQYLASDALLSRLLQPGLLLLAWQALKGLVLALLLLLGTLALDGSQQALLLADALLLGLIGLWLARRLSSQLRPGVAGALLRRWAHRINAPLLWLGLMATRLAAPSAPAPAPAGDWLGAVQQAAGSVTVGCDALALLARMQAVADVSLRWAVARLAEAGGGGEQTLLAGLLVTLFFGVSFVVAWAFSLALTGVTARPWAQHHGQAG